ncbi:hypothetical protein QE152_g24791 [Popillia japonica]|uniref:Uncharacterized protein n=1 Tax=Popillia japonica TaxID=7064 RepID=A0AAW1K3D7_POPJA
MSKCPLQIYLNDRYLDSRTSVGPANIFKKTFEKGCYKPAQLIYHKKFNRPGTILENDNKNKITTHNQNFPKCGSKSILSEYLNRHSKSIEAYHSLQKQQEEVLKLCKKKLAEKFPRAVLKDEDIITALRIAQTTPWAWFVILQ